MLWFVILAQTFFLNFLKIKHHSKLKAVPNQSLGKDVGEQHWVISDSAQCIEMILTGLYADSLSTWYCVLLDVHCSYDTFNVFFKKMSLLPVMGLTVSLSMMWMIWTWHVYDL